MLQFNEDMDVVTGTTLKWVFYVLDNDNTTLNIEGYEFKMQIRASNSLIAKLLLDCTEYLDYTTYADKGIVILTVPNEITAELLTNPLGYYDLKAKLPNDEVYIVSKGKVKIVPSITSF